MLWTERAGIGFGEQKGQAREQRQEKSVASGDLNPGRLLSCGKGQRGKVCYVPLPGTVLMGSVTQTITLGSPVEEKERVQKSDLSSLQKML